MKATHQNKTTALRTKAPQRQLCCSAQSSYSRMTAVSKDEGLSPDTDSTSAVISSYSSRTLRSKYWLFINHPVWYSVMIAGMTREIQLLIAFFSFKCIISASSKLFFPHFVLITNSFQIFVTYVWQSLAVCSYLRMVSRKLIGSYLQVCQLRSYFEGGLVRFFSWETPAFTAFLSFVYTAGTSSRLLTSDCESGSQYTRDKWERLFSHIIQYENFVLTSDGMHSLLCTILPVFPLIYPAIFFFFFVLSLELYVCVCIYTHTYIFFNLGGEKVGWIPVWERSPGGGQGFHSSILAWRIP